MKEKRIYALDLATEKVRLLYSRDDEIYTLALRLNRPGELVFAQKTYGVNYENIEIFTVNADVQNLKRITDNSYWDFYPAWFPDGHGQRFFRSKTMILTVT